MPDTIRSLATLQAMLADNSSGAITAQVERDLLVSAYRPECVRPGGRLTLAPGVPVTTADVAGAGTLYYTPFEHDAVGLYDGASWTLHQFSEVGLALSGLASGRNYDVFLCNNAGALTLELSAAWADDLTRADALGRVGGVEVKAAATSRRLVGTIRATGAATAEDSTARRFVWNRHNRIRRQLLVAESTDSWNYAGGAVRQANGSAANKVEFVQGLAIDAIDAEVRAQAYLGSNSARAAKAGVGLDSLAAFSGLVQGGYNTNTANGYFPMGGTFRGLVAPGYHYLAWLESGADGTCTFLGDNGSDGQQTGLYAEVWS